ncbi:MAG: hypothetical protein FJY66_05890, partial [Calditrichaeota bacterium]|nr:hypothetical protein [Calditrichota bacterium]
MSHVETVVRESQIEDILVGAPAILKDVLSLPDEPRIVIRQMMLPSGRLDLLLTCRARLQLVELKIVPYQPAFVDQVLSYKNDLRAMQSNGRLIQG